MNKKILFVTASALAATAAFGFVKWEGTTDRVNTELGGVTTTDTYGYWFSYDDSNDQGLSKVTWPVATGNGYDEKSLQPIIEYCGGLCGHITLSGAALKYDPFVGLGFNVAGETSEADKTPAAADASSWGGICIAYKSDLAPVLELGLGDAFDQSLKYDNPVARMAKSVEGGAKEFAWDDFAQAGWGANQGGGSITGPEAAKQLVSIKFKIQAADGLEGDFNIVQVGPFGSGCEYKVQNSIKGVHAASGVKAFVSGRTLSFSGISSDASVEVISLQGRVVKKGMVKGASSLDLSSIDAGVYMVRVSGKSVDYSNKIVLK